MFNILVVEDDKNSVKLIMAVLKHAGYEVYPAANGMEALKVLDKQFIDLIVLDVMMPKMNGYEFTTQLRSCGNNIPILMLTARPLSEEKYKGFLVGADDYMIKPMNEDELIFRIKALLRRSRIASEHKLRIGELILDYDSLTVSRGNITQTIPQKEFYLLYTLLSYPNNIFTRLQLMDEIWGVESQTVDTTVNVHINRLRKKFDGYTEFEILSIRGIGYKAVIKNE